MAEVTPIRGLIKQDADSYVDVAELTHNFEVLDVAHRIQDEEGNYLEVTDQGYLKTNPELVHGREYQSAGTGNIARLLYITRYGTLGVRTDTLFRGDQGLLPGMEIAFGKTVIMPTLTDPTGAAKVGYVDVVLPERVRDYDGLMLSLQSTVPSVVQGKPAVFNRADNSILTLMFKRTTDVGTSVEWLVWKEVKSG